MLRSMKPGHDGLRERVLGQGSARPRQVVENPHERDLKLGAYGAIARFLALACVTTGTPRSIALEQPDDGAVAYHEHKRTQSAGKVSVATVRSYLGERVSSFIHSDAGSGMATFLRGHLVGEGGYAPSAQRRGRRRLRGHGLRDISDRIARPCRRHGTVPHAAFRSASAGRELSELPGFTFGLRLLADFAL